MYISVSGIAKISLAKFAQNFSVKGLNGLAPITHDTALKLKSVIGPSAEFWIELESNYQLNKIRLDEKKHVTLAENYSPTLITVFYAFIPSA